MGPRSTSVPLIALLLVASCSVGSRAVGDGDAPPIDQHADFDASVAIPSATSDAGHDASKSDAAIAPPPGPALADLFAGRARFQRDDEAQRVSFAFPDNITMSWDQKKVVVASDGKDGYFTVTRGIVNVPAVGQRYALYRLRSTDAVHFTQDGPPIFPGYASWNLSDAHLAQDPSGGWLMTFQCENPGVSGPEICVSQSTTPLFSETWSAPTVIVADEILPARSASSGAALYAGGKLYVKWTVIDNDTQPFTEGTESSSSRALAVTNLTSLGSATSVGQVLLPTTADPFCTNRWDCNNRDVQDWVVEGSYVYASYSGGNYYRCARQGLDYGANDWSLAVARATTPLGTWEGTAPLVPAPTAGYCSIGAPTLAKIRGDWWMYYAISSADSTVAPSNRRVKLVWNAASTPAALPCSTALPGFVASATQDDAVRVAHCLALADVAAATTVSLESGAITAGTSTRRSILRDLALSDAFDLRWHVTTLDQAHYVVLIYNLLLHRLPTDQEKTTWTNALNGATTTRESFVDTITSSAELGARFPLFDL